MFLLKQNFECGLGMEQNLVLKKEKKQLLPFLRKYSTIQYFSGYLYEKYFIFAIIDNSFMSMI